MGSRVVIEKKHWTPPPQKVVESSLNDSVVAVRTMLWLPNVSLGHLTLAQHAELQDPAVMLIILLC